MPGKFLHFLKSPTAICCSVVLGMSGCAPLAERMLTRVEASVANDQMMLVRSLPPSFGYQRLLTGMRDHPDLAVFVNQHGLPDFLAETGDRANRYLILYYLGKREAFACRTVPGRSREVEFAGPYPITDREFKTLDAVRQRAAVPDPAE